MLHNNPCFTEMIATQTGPDIDVLRYCLSDESKVSINGLFDGSSTPLKYASSLLKYHYAEIYNRFFKDRLLSFKISEPFARSWIFDKIVMSAALCRISVLRPGGMKGVCALASCANVFPLTLNPNKFTNASFSGLGDFSLIADDFICYNVSHFCDNKTTRLSAMISHISHIESPEWLFYDPLWAGIFLHSPAQSRVLRNFFHLALVSYMSSGQLLQNVFEIERDEVTSFIDDFVELREDRNTTKKHITDFVYSLSCHFEELPDNYLYKFLFEGSFEVTRYIHQQNFGTQFDEPESNTPQLISPLPLLRE